MKFILKKLRRHQLSNRLVSSMLKKLYGSLNDITERWTPYGAVAVEFNDIKFISYSEADDYVTGSLYYRKPILESADIGTFLNFARHSSTILDIGANVGLYSILSAKVNEGASIYAFEPNEVNARRLRKNIGLNALKNIEVVQNAVGDKPGTIQFNVPVAEMISDSSSAVEEFSKNSYDGALEWKSVSVEQTSVDAFVAQRGLRGVDLMKIDVEGYEMMVLKGAQASIAAYKPVIQCEIFVKEEQKQFFDAFSREHGYTPYILLDEGLLRLDGGVQPHKGHNFIFLPQSLPDLLTPVEKALSFLYQS